MSKFKAEFGITRKETELLQEELKGLGGVRSINLGKIGIIIVRKGFWFKVIKIYVIINGGWWYNRRGKNSEVKKRREGRRVT